MSRTVPSAARRWLLLAVALAALPAGWRVLNQEPAPTAFAVRAADPIAAGPGATELAAADKPVVRAVSSRPGAAVHAASSILLRDGRVRAVWFSGSREGASDVSIRTAVFDPAQGTWTPEAEALSRPQLAAALARSIKKLGNPVLTRAPDGGLQLYVVAVSLGGWAGSSITRLESDDEGVSWRSPRRLVTSPFLNLGTLVKGPPVAYADGRIGLPVYHELIERFPEWLVLDADARVLSRVRLPASINNLQPVVRVLDSRHAEILMRHASQGTPPRVTRSHSTDAGRSWTPVEPTGLPNPNAAVSVLARRGGDSLLVFNDTETGRGNLSLGWAVAASDPAAPLDWRRLARLDGEAGSVPPGLPAADYRSLLSAGIDGVDGLDKAGAEPDALVASAMRQLCWGTADAQTCNREFSYPSLVEGADGAVHLFYTWHRARILHVQMSPQWIVEQQRGARP